MQGMYALDNIIQIVNQITKNQKIQGQQQVYAIWSNQLNKINDIVTKNKEILNSLNNGFCVQVEGKDCGNLNDLIQCYKVVTSLVNEYYNTNLYAKLGYKPKVGFWQKTKEVIKDAKAQTQSLKQQIKKLPELEKLKNQLNKLPTLRKQQLEAIKQMSNHLINGQLTEFKKKHSFNKKYSYNNQLRQSQQYDGYLLQHNINPEILESISGQFGRIQKLEQKLKSILQFKPNSSSIQYNKSTIVDKCTYLAEQIEKNMKNNREELKAMSKLEQTQRKIIMGQSPRFIYYETNRLQKMLEPIIEEYKLIKQAIDNLKKILNNPYLSGSKLSLGQTFKYLVENLQNIIREAGNKMHIQIGSGNQGSVNTIGGLIALISSHKTILQIKSINGSSSNRYPTEQQNVRIIYSQNNNNNWNSETEANNLINKMNQQKKQILENIRLTGVNSESFMKKYSSYNKYDKNRQYNDQVIIAVLQATRVAMQIPANTSLINYIINLQQAKQQKEWLFATQQTKTQKLQNMVWSQQKNNKVQYHNYDNINTTQGNSQTKQIIQECMKQNEKLTQQIKKLDASNKQLVKKSKQQYDLSSKNINKIYQLEKQLKQRNTLIQQLTTQIEEKNEQINNLSYASNRVASNSNSEKDKIIEYLQGQTQRLSSQSQHNLEQKQLFESQYNLLNTEIGQVIQRANSIFKEKQLTSITSVFQHCLKQLQEKRKQYKLKCSQNQKILQQLYRNIQKKVENIKIDSVGDLQNLIQRLYRSKIQCSQKLQKNIQNLKSIQNILIKIALPQPSTQQNQNQTQPLSQQQKITSQIISKLNLLMQSNIKHKTLKFNDRSRILANNKEEKFIVQELTNYLGDNPITRFNLLYRYSQGGNLAEAITAHPNTVLIIKTNGVIIACYSSLSYCQTVDMKQRKGLLIETHTNSSYSLKSGSKPVEYDENNLIFGNKILKISKKEKNHKIQIDFNQKNSVFENEKKHKIYDLFKSTDKQIEFQDFQLYEIEQKNNDTVIVQRSLSQSDPIRQSRIMTLTKAEERVQETKTSVPKNNTSKGKVSIRELTQQVEKHKKGIVTLKKQNEELKKKIESLESTKATTEQKNKNTGMAINTPNRNTLTLPGINRTTSNQSQQTQFQKQMDQMTRKLKNTEQSLLQKTHKLNQVQNKTKQQDQKIKQLIKQKQASINQSVRNEKNVQLENIRNQKLQIQKKLSELQLEYKKQKEQVNKKIKQLQQMKKQLEETKSQIQRLKQSNQKIITELNEQKSNLVQQNEKLRQQKIKQQLIQPRSIVGVESNNLDNLGLNQQIQNFSNFSNIRTSQSQQKKIIRYASHISEQSGTRSIVRTESGFNMNEAFIHRIKKQFKFQQKQFDYKFQPQTSSETYKEMIQKLKTELDQLKQGIQKEKQGIQKQKQQNDKKILSLEREKQKLQGIIKSNTTQLGEYYKKTQQLEKEIKKLKEGKSQLLQIPSPSPMNLQSPAKSPTKNIQSSNRSLNQKDYPKQLKKQVEENKKILTKIMESKNLIEKECTQKQADLFKINQRHKKATQTLKQLQDKAAKLKQEQEDIIKLMGQLQARKRQKEQLGIYIGKLKDQIIILDKQINEKRQQIDRQKIQIYNLKNQKQMIARENKKMDQISNKIQQKAKQLEIITEKLNQVNANSNKIQQNIQSLKEKQSQQRRLTDLAIKEQGQINQAIKKISTELNSLQKQKLKYGGFPNRLFIGQTLSDELDRQYIIQQVQKLYPKQKIVNSRLLYAYPLMRNLNPHQSVDEVPSYIIIMKLFNKQPITKKNYVLAMYSEKPLIKGAPINNGQGFVSAVTKKSTFSIRNVPSMNPRLTQYNEFYFIFGNSQFRFRINSNKIQISVGHNFRSLDTGDIKTPELFAGTTQADVQIISYEIYQLYFDRKY